MARLTTYKEALELVLSEPENRSYFELFSAATDLAIEKGELEFRAYQLGDAIKLLTEQMDRLTEAEVAQRIVEIRTGLGR